MAEPIPCSQSQVTMTEMVMPQHINAVGSIFGGVIMSWIDIAAAIASMRHCGMQTVTASIDALNFVQPVYKGWIVNVRASVNFVSHTSMEVGVRVDAENPLTKKMFHTASAYMTFVAIDANGKPQPVPQVLPQTPEEVRRHAAAAKRRAARLEQRKLEQK